MANDVTESQQAKKWLYDTLHGNVDIAASVGTNIFAGAVPSPRPTRYILYDLLAAVDVHGVGSVRVLTQPLFQVRLVIEGWPDTSARLVAKRIDDVLRSAKNQISGDYVFSSQREQEVDRHEIDTSTNKHYHNLGGIYRLHTARTA